MYWFTLRSRNKKARNNAGVPLAVQQAKTGQTYVYY